MRCPFCSGEDTQVKDSRPADDGAAIRRRRLCNSCGARFTTFERVQLRELFVLKSSGRKVPFDREKLQRSILIATRKRDIDQEMIDRTVSGIVRTLEQTGETEVTSRTIGQHVMQALREIDDVAF
ncbi:MAG: transcriptional regulator NrdR, partial [Pseudomonadota bacterium]